MTDNVKILFIGDIVGRPGRNIVKHYLERLESDNVMPDFVIANVENASHGFGLSEKNHKQLCETQIGCFTSGNHIWDKKEVVSYIETSSRLIRPANYPKGTPGTGVRIFSVNESKIAVINLLGRTFMSPVDSPWQFMEENIENIKQEAPIVIVDFHAEATAEKICFGRFCADLGVSAVIGTHTHVQTADERILNQKTAYITDAGFCGVYNSVIGMDCDVSIRRLLTALPERFDVASGSVLQLEGVQMAFDPISGAAKSIERIQFIKDINEETT